MPPPPPIDAAAGKIAANHDGLVAVADKLATSMTADNSVEGTEDALATSTGVSLSEQGQESSGDLTDFELKCKMCYAQDA